jgi:hypothetical protein
MRCAAEIQCMLLGAALSPVTQFLLAASQMAGQPCSSAM